MKVKQTIFVKWAIFLVLCVVVPSFCAWSGRNTKLRDIPDRTWLKVCKYNGASDFLGGSSEVPWTYDANSKLFVRVGGCTGGYTNAVVLFDLGTETTTAPWGGWDVTAPTNRPGGGCQRGIGYDPITKIVYEMGGGASSDYGVYGYWKGDIPAGTWTHYAAEAVFRHQVQVAADTANKVVVHTGRSMGSFRGCMLYYPATDSLVRAPVRPGSSSLEEAIGHDWWPTMQYAPGLGGTMYFAWMNGIGWFTWLFDAKTRTWTDLNPTGLENSPLVSNYISQRFRPVLSWDNAANVMLLHIPTFGIYAYNPSGNAWEKVVETNPQNISSQMFDYDDEHNVHVMASYNYSYDQDIWAFRYVNETPVKVERLENTLAETVVEALPNPFNPQTQIMVNLKQASDIRLTVLDVSGKLVKTLSERNANAGSHTFVWNATDNRGGAIPAGLYILKLTAGHTTVTRKIILAR